MCVSFGGLGRNLLNILSSRAAIEGELFLASCDEAIEASPHRIAHMGNGRTQNAAATPFHGWWDTLTGSFLGWLATAKTL